MGWNNWRVGSAAAGLLLVACGGDARRSSGTSAGQAGSGGSGGDGPGVVTRTSSAGSGGTETSGFGASGGTGGAGEAPGCRGTAQRVDACVDYLEGSAGEGGLGGRGPFPEFDECPDDAEFGECDQTLSGRVTAVGSTESWCDDPRFLWTTPDDSLGEQRVILLTNDDTPVGYDAGVAFGPVRGELDVDVGDELEVVIQKGWYHAGFMHGTRITVMREGELIAVVNDEYPVDGLTRIAELEFDRGRLSCRGPEDDFSCTYLAHWLNASLDGETEPIEPGSEAVLEPFEIVVDENYAVQDGGACDDGDTTRFGAFRFVTRD